MLVTPGTAKVHGGAPSRWGSTQPPMHASTWQRMPRSGGQGGDLGDGVDDPVRVRGGRRDDEHGVVVDGRRRGQRGRRGGSSWSTSTTRACEPEVLRALEERRVRGDGQHEVGPVHVRCALPGREHREEDRLGAARGDRPGEPVGGVEEAARHRDEVVLHPQQRREGGGVEGVRRGEHRERVEAEGVGVGEPRVVDVGEGAAAVRRAGPGPAARGAGPAARRRSWRAWRRSSVNLLLVTVLGHLAGAGSLREVQGAAAPSAPGTTTGAGQVVSGSAPRRAGSGGARPSTRTTSTAGTTEKPMAMARRAESGCAASASVDET